MIHINDRLTSRSARIARYRRLLTTDLTEIERRYIERRLAEESAAVPPIMPAFRSTARPSSGVKAPYSPDMR